MPRATEEWHFLDYVELSDEDEAKKFDFPETDTSPEDAKVPNFCNRCVKSIAKDRICDLTRSKKCKHCAKDSGDTKCTLVNAKYHGAVNTIIELHRTFVTACKPHFRGCDTDEERSLAFNRSEDCKRTGRDLKMAQLTLNRTIQHDHKEAEKTQKQGANTAAVVKNGKPVSFGRPSSHRYAPPPSSDRFAPSPGSQSYAPSHKAPSQSSTPHQPAAQQPDRKAGANSHEAQTSHANLTTNGPTTSACKDAIGDNANGKRAREASKDDAATAPVELSAKERKKRRLMIKLEKLEIEEQMLDVDEED